MVYLHALNYSYACRHNHEMASSNLICITILIFTWRATHYSYSCASPSYIYSPVKGLISRDILWQALPASERLTCTCTWELRQRTDSRISGCSYRMMLCLVQVQYQYQGIATLFGILPPICVPVWQKTGRKLIPSSSSQVSRASITNAKTLSQRRTSWRGVYRETSWNCERKHGAGKILSSSSFQSFKHTCVRMKTVQQ